MHYILDGYNIIYKLPQLGGTSIRNNREKLIKYIHKEKRQLSKKNKISIVFDGRQGIMDYPSAYPEIQTFFSHQINADDYIIGLIKRAENPKLITVVTDDKELQTRVRLLEASVIEVNDFFGSNKKKVESQEIKPSLTYKELEEIKEELISREGQCL